MKKGLLGLLVIALTVVGCQNYDDQFDSLNDKIASLSSEVSSLKAIQTTVTALSSKLDDLANSALSDEDLEEILKEVNEVKSTVAAIEDVTTEVEDLNEEVDTILEKLGDLLSANAFYEGNLTITNLGQLANAHELIKTGDDDPTITVKGNVLVVVGTALKDSIASVQLILNKLRSVQGTASLTTEVNASLPALTYVTGDLDLNGKDGKAAITAEKLLTIDGNMSVTGLTGVVAFASLGSVGTVSLQEIAGKATITTLNLGGLTQGTVQTGTGSLVLAKATNVHLGGTLPALVNLPACVEFAHTTGGSQGNLDLTLGGKAATMSMGSTKFTGTTTITTTGNVELTNLTEIATTTISLGTAKSEVHLTAVKKITGTVSISANGTVVDLASLAELNANMNLHGATAVDLPVLAKSAVSGVVTITAPLATSFTAPKLDTKSTTLSLKPATDLTLSLLNIADTATPTNDIGDWARVKVLTLAAQTGNLDVSAAAVLATLNFTGKQVTPAAEDAQNNSLSITASNTKLTDLTLGAQSYLGTLTVSASAIKTLSTAGYIINTKVTNNASLETFNFAHGHVQGDRESTVSIAGNANAKLTSIDLSSLSKVGTVIVTGNTALTGLVAPSADVLATSLATITVTISGNKLAGTYKPATAPTGTVTYSGPAITSAVLSSFKAWINANKNVDIANPAGADRTILTTTASATAEATGSAVTGNAIIYNMDLDKVDNTSTTAEETVTLSSLMNADDAATAGATGAAGDNDNDDTGGVTTARELATVAD